MTTKRNGTKPGGQGFQLPKKTAVIQLNGDYQGAEVTVWINPPFGLWERAAAKEIDNKQLMGEMILSWNLIGYDGKHIPPPSEGGLSAVPIDLLSAIDAAITEKMQQTVQLPKANDEQ